MDGGDRAQCNMDTISWRDKSPRGPVAKCNMKSFIYVSASQHRLSPADEPAFVSLAVLCLNAAVDHVYTEDEDGDHDVCVCDNASFAQLYLK